MICRIPFAGLQWPLPLDVCLLAGLVTAGLVAARRLPLFSFGIGWFFVFLLPTSLIPRADLLSERNLYPAFLGLMLVYRRPWPRGSSMAHDPSCGRASWFGSARNGVSIGFLLMLCLFTFQRNALYRRRDLALVLTQFRNLRKRREPHNNLGHAYAIQDEWERAIEEFRIAAQLDPDYALAQEKPP